MSYEEQKMQEQYDAQHEMEQQANHKQYGFYTEEYECGGSIETLMTGDGKTQFTDVFFDNGEVALGMSYGRGTGVGTKEHYPEKTLATEADVKWQVKFESLGSIDSMIETMQRVRARFVEMSES